MIARNLAFGLDLDTEKYFGQEERQTLNTQEGIRAWMRDHGLDYKVLTVNHKNALNGQPTHFYDVYREDTREILGSGLSSRFTTIQNDEAVEILSAFAGEAGGMVMARGMTFDGGRVAVAQIDLGEMVIGDTGRGGFKDVVKRRITWANAHDGSGRMKYFTTPTRIVCANTLTRALNGSDDGFAISHTKSAEDRLRAAKRAYHIIGDRLVKTERVFQALARKRVTEDHMREYLFRLFPAEGKTESQGAKNAKEQADSVARLWRDADGGRIDPATAWNAYNAATKHFCHSGAVRLHDETISKEEGRAKAVLFGSIAEKNGRALQTLVEVMDMEDDISRILRAVETSQAAQLATYAPQPVSIWDIGIGQ
jgi:phage/plasmid-like protein (TIGR03299 family)